MRGSDNICCGIIWTFDAVEQNDLCKLRGLTVAHKYTDYKKLEWTYHDLVSGNFQCDTKKRIFDGPVYQTSWRTFMEKFRIYSDNTST